MGRVRIAQLLARAGLHLAPTTVRRLAHEQPRRPSPTPPETTSVTRAATRRVTAREPHHVWHVDLTVVPTSCGLWAPWLPQCLAQRWPFAWWVGVVLDHFTRHVVAEAVFEHGPSAAAVCAMLDDAVSRAGRAPKHIISDQGVQFRDDYRAWCTRHDAKPRFGAVGKSGSIAILERFIRSMKDEALRRISVPYEVAAMRAEVVAYTSWYNTRRPHQSLGGATPHERLTGAIPARELERIETRPRYPLARADQSARRVSGQLRLVVRRQDERDHLPVIDLREAA